MPTLMRYGHSALRSAYLVIVYVVHLYCFIVATVVSAALETVRHVVGHVAEVLVDTVTEIADALVVSIGRALIASEFEYICAEQRTYSIAELIALHDQDQLYQQR